MNKETLIKELKPGDILLYSPRSLLGYLIKVKTWSRFTHCEVYLGDGFSAAARFSGVNTYKLDPEFTAILRPEVPCGHTLDLSEALEFHTSCIGQKYHTLGLLRFFTIGKQDQTRAICSEHATRICRHFVILSLNFPELKCFFRPFAIKYDADLVSPGMFYASPHFDVVWESSGSIFNLELDFQLGTPMLMRPSSVTTSRVQVLDSASTIILAASNRIGFSIYNDTGQTLYVRFSSSAAASTTKSFQILSGGFYESPIGFTYCGDVTARIAAGTSGYVDVTEFFA